MDDTSKTQQRRAMELIRASETLDANLKRAWLDALPHMTAEHMNELLRVLENEQTLIAEARGATP